MTSPARPLILFCGASMALFDFVALLPGNPAVASAGRFLFVVALQALIVWRLLHRSALAWAVVLLFSGSYTAMVVLAGGPYETTLVISGILSAMQVGFLLTPPVLSYVFGEDKPVASH